MGGPEALGGFGKGVLRFAEGREGAVAVVPGRSVSLLLIVEDRGGPFEENFGGREVLGKPLPLFALQNEVFAGRADLKLEPVPIGPGLGRRDSLVSVRAP